MSRPCLAYGVALVALLLVAYLAAPFVPRTVTVADGEPLPLGPLRGWRPRVLSATYAGAAAPVADVAVVLQASLDALPAGVAAYVASGPVLGLPAGGVFVVRFRACAAKRPPPTSPASGFYPVRRSPCARRRAEAYTPRPRNPIIDTVNGTFVRAASHAMQRGASPDFPSQYELERGQPGYIEEIGDDAVGLSVYTSGRRSPAVAGGEPSCLLASGDIDSDFRADNVYEQAVAREALTSRREATPNTLVASRTGLGSTRLDPRFEPGPQSRVVMGDASPSPGGHAGGITLGAFGSSRFFPGNVWDARYVHGRPDAGHHRRAEAIFTERSRWPV